MFFYYIILWFLLHYFLTVRFAKREKCVRAIYIGTRQLCLHHKFRDLWLRRSDDIHSSLRSSCELTARTYLRVPYAPATACKRSSARFAVSMIERAISLAYTLVGSWVGSPFELEDDDEVTPGRFLRVQGKHTRVATRLNV